MRGAGQCDSSHGEGGDHRGPRLKVVQQAWAELDVSQCGYCQPGMIMAAAALLAQNSKPSEDEIRDGITNICRCGTYPRVLAAVQLAARRLADRSAA